MACASTRVRIDNDGDLDDLFADSGSECYDSDSGDSDEDLPRVSSIFLHHYLGGRGWCVSLRHSKIYWHTRLIIRDPCIFQMLSNNMAI